MSAWELLARIVAGLIVMGLLFVANDYIAGLIRQLGIEPTKEAMRRAIAVANEYV